MKSNARKTIVQFLEEQFGNEPLIPSNRRLFVDIDRKKADEVLGAYNDYVKEFGDFRIPPSNEVFGRPFIWHEIAATASSYGGNLFINPAERVLAGASPHTSADDVDILATRRDRLRLFLLTNYQVVLPDQLWIGIGAATHNQDQIRSRYAGYIDFLIAMRELIQADIIIVCSEKQMSEIAPINDGVRNYRFKDWSLTEFLRERNQLPIVTEMLGYFSLLKNYDAVPFIDDEGTLHAFETMLEYCQIQPRKDATTVQPLTLSLPFTARKLSDSDFVKVRLHDETFTELRNAVNKALQASSPDEARDFLFGEIENISQKAPESLKSLIARSFTLGLLTNTVVTLLTQSPFWGVLGGAAVGTGAEIMQTWIQRRLSANQDLARESLIHFYTAMMGDVGRIDK